MATKLYKQYGMEPKPKCQELNRGRACDFIGRQFLHISTYFCICAAILHGNEHGNYTVRPILRARFEVRSMLLASTLYYAESWSRQLTYLYKKGKKYYLYFVGSLLAREFDVLVHKSVHFAYQDVGGSNGCYGAMMYMHTLSVSSLASQTLSVPQHQSLSVSECVLHTESDWRCGMERV